MVHECTLAQPFSRSGVRTISRREPPSVHVARRRAPVLALVLLAPPLLAQSSQDAERVLHAATMAMGGPSVMQIHTIETVAACRGPKSTYRTIVRSARDGRARFEQDFADGHRDEVGLSPHGAWEYDSDSGRYLKATALTYAEVRGHEIHMLSIAPESRLGRPVAAIDTVFRQTSAIAALFRDTLGGTVRAFYSRRDTTLLGFSFPNHRDPASPAIELVLTRWRRIGGALLPTRAVYWQGRDAYRFRFTHIRLNELADSDFAAPPELGTSNR